MSSSADGSQVLVLLGDAGLGKTILLAEAVREARSAGMRVLSVSGRESEQNLAFAGLHLLLLLPVLDQVRDLPDRQKKALLHLDCTCGCPQLGGQLRSVLMTESSLYRKVAEDIRAAIASGEYPASAKLPSESELAQRYGVSRGTIRQAFAALRADGVIASRRGARRGVFGGRRGTGHLPQPAPALRAGGRAARDR